MAPSCVPASPFESPRRPLGPGDLESLMRRRRVLGLAEMMNFPAVVSGSATELEKLALQGAAHVDGHAPGLLGKELQAYVAAGIRSDHEALTVEEGRERLRAGMWLLIREASMARSLQALLPLALEYGPARIAFCTDDRDPEDIADDGHINGMVREAVAAGVPVGGCPDHGLAERGPVAQARSARGDRSRLSRRSPRAARSGAVPTRSRPEARPPDRSQAVDTRSRLGPSDRADRAHPPLGSRDSLCGREDPCDRADRGSGRDAFARLRPGRGRGPRYCRSDGRSRQDRRDRAPPRNRPRRARLRLGVEPGTGGSRFLRRTRCPQPGRRRDERRAT